jgi:hypothetical protein
MSERFQRINAAYETALAGRDPNTVSILDLLPVIHDAVPNTSDDEIVDALRWSAEQYKREAEQLQRYHNAKFGNKGKFKNMTKPMPVED